MITEKTVARLWEECRSAVFVTDDGKRVSVISPGRASHQEGGDFSDSVMEIDDRRRTGKVEIHVFSDLWDKHGHKNDPAYDDIIMHIAMWRNGDLPVRSLSGEAIPTIILSENLDSGIYALINLQFQDDRLYACGERGNSVETLNSLYELGLRWFDERAGSLSQMLLIRDPQQLLYQKIARALGYAANGDAFERLAARLPLRQLLCEAGTDVEAMQACLLGTAGLLPSQRAGQSGFIGDEFTAAMEKNWGNLKGGSVAKNENEWSFYNLRPENHPCRRLAGLAYLVKRCVQDGFLRLINNPLYMLEPVRAIRSLENRLMVGGEGYWSNHSDFNSSLPEKCSLIGRGKADEIAINAILPLKSACIRYTGKPMRDKGKELFSAYPALSENRIVKFMRKELNMGQGVRLSACQQQGMFYLYRGYCRRKECLSCPLYPGRR